MLPTVASASNHERVISNTAYASWDSNGAERRQPSNRVDLDVGALPQSLLTYRLTGDGGSSSTSLAGASCTGSGGTVPFSFEGVRSNIPLNAADIARSNSIHAGEPLIFSVAEPFANANDQAIDTLRITLETPGGDHEVVTMVESGINTGIFFGVIATRAVPPTPVQNDCLLSLRPGETLSLGAVHDSDPDRLEATVEVLIDPYGIAFDSGNGAEIPGTRISIVDAVTRQPADIFGDDGVSRYPSTVITGETVTDSGGQVYTFPPGEYRFPFARAGRYALIVEPPAPFTFPSIRTAADMAALRRPDGGPLAIVDGSYGGIIVLSDPAPVRVDIPLDHQPPTGLMLTKTASQSIGEAGDVIQYRVTVGNSDGTRYTGPITVTDLLPPQMRLRLDTVRVNGEKVAGTVTADGSRLTVAVPALPGGGTALLTYALEVRSDARAGDSLNRASAIDTFGNVSGTAEALVRIRRDSIADRITIVGRVTEGACSVDQATAPGIAGVRIMLEDGSYSVTDFEGRYHFEGVKAGTHVVQLDDSSLPANRVLADCTQNTRSAGRAFSRFVEARGGALMRVDFHAVEGQGRKAKAIGAARPEPASDAAAAGAERDWFADGKRGIAWLFPEIDHNPRAPVIRVAIRHNADQAVKLFKDGKPVDMLSYEGVRKDASALVGVSIWRGIPLDKRQHMFTAQVMNSDGSIAETLERVVHFSASPMQAELIREKSILVADGVTRPVIAVKLTDRDGRPVHHGLVGDFEVPAPYYPAVEADAQQARQLAGLERARPVWRVLGEDGIAYIELEPTTASGSVNVTFNFRDGDSEREQRIDTWLDPGDRPWTIVGLATGTVGYNKLEGRLEDIGDAKDDLLVDGRLALYAKGRIQGKWLMTLAYDTDKKEKETQFGGVIDPQSYYTIYADQSERRYDAASVRRLYLKLERPQFYALFGDYDTGISEPQLARYVRSLNGLKAEYGSKSVSAVAFAADAPNRHGRDEIQGNGLTGPYALRSRDILANSEQVVIEVRDRERSNVIVETRQMTRHIDYDIDYAAGVLRFREPILSRSPSLDPQFIVVNYEVDGIGTRSLNAGARVSWRSDNQKVQVSGTALHDSNDQGRTMLAGADVRYRPTASTEIRAEAAVSDGQAKAGATAPAAGTATAWLVEAEHHGSKYDVLAYAREQQGGFGVGQTNRSEGGTRKIGADGRVALRDDLALTASAWREEDLSSIARRTAGRALLEYRGKSMSARAGVTIADDLLSDGRTAGSTILQFGATRKFFNNRLELDAQTELPVGNKDQSIDFPARYRLGARYSVTRDVQIVGAYEIADGDAVDARTARFGVEVKPWAGARIAVTGNMQDIAEYGPRSFAAYGLSQSLLFGKHWSADFSVDGNKTLAGIDPTRVLDPDHPVTSGGYVGDGSTLTEDFTALTAGATYRADLWSVTGRGEYRMSELGDRYGFTAAALRQIGEGSALGGAFNFFVAGSATGTETRTANLQMSWAHRPANSAFSWLDKLELRDDRVTGAVAGGNGPIGIPLTISGDAASRRIVNSLAVNWSPADDYGRFMGPSEISLFWGTRYVADRFGEDDIKGWSNIIGADMRFDISDRIDFGASGTIRQGIGMRSFSYSGGPSIGISPFDNGWISVGYNIVGFQDRDFTDDRYTRAGPYVTMRLKFDQTTLQGLGLGR